MFRAGRDQRPVGRLLNVHRAFLLRVPAVLHGRLRLQRCLLNGAGDTVLPPC
jgi:hypothetical protein